MGQPIIQTSFNSGEWAPALNARVDLGKYHSGAALLRNFFVDYRGGATTRPGTKYILQAKGGGTGVVRLFPFQASFSVTYMLEFGEQYIRFYNNGAPVLEAAKTPTAITQANPGVITINGHGYGTLDVVFISNVGGMTQLNGNYYVVVQLSANTFSLQNLDGSVVNTTTYSAFTSGGSVQRVYTLASPYSASDLSQIKFAQNVNTLILCHPNYQPRQLVLTTATNWAISTINFGPTLTAPSISSLTSTLGAGNWYYGYRVTAVDVNGQESSPSNLATIGPLADMRAAPSGTNLLQWAAVAGAVSYNIYKAISPNGNLPTTTVQYGYVGNVTGTIFFDSNISPDFSISAPIATNPFSGSSVQSITLTATGANYTSVPAVSLTNAPGGGTNATATCTLQTDTAAVASGGNLAGFGNGYHVGDYLYAGTYGTYQVTAVNGFFQVTSISIVTRGIVLSGIAPVAPVQVATTTNGLGSNCTLFLTWRVGSLTLSNAGAGYLIAPSVTFVGGGGSGAAGNTVLGASAGGNPTVPSFFQQRSFFGGLVTSPSQFNLSQPGAPYNYNITFPAQADNAIQATLTNTTLNSIKSATPVSAGLLILTDKGAWLLNGGSPGSGLSALSPVANQQAYSGSSDLPPIVTPNDLLYVQSKGSIVRDLSYNFYVNNYVGADISIISSHLFYGYNITQWCWAEEPFKLAWAVRNDGTLLSLTFVKEQELIAWAHHDTNGTYTSVASVTETTVSGNVDAVYVVARRIINGNTVQYIERFTELYYPQGYISAWQVDAGIQYSGSPATNFSGAMHLANTAVVGLADGIPFTATVSATGTFTLGTAASLVTVGLSFSPQLGTLALDLGEPTVQGKRKNVSAVNLRVRDTLGLSAGKSLTDQKVMKDLVLGNVGTQSNAVVAGLVTSDARIILPPQYDVFGSYFITQPNPYPASILGVMPEVTVGDTR